jgi:hypothetical protein
MAGAMLWRRRQTRAPCLMWQAARTPTIDYER